MKIELGERELEFVRLSVKHAINQDINFRDDNLSADEKFSLYSKIVNAPDEENKLIKFIGEQEQLTPEMKRILFDNLNLWELYEIS